jgi:DNA-binding transcriptional regulator GbsR (MarR family)
MSKAKTKSQYIDDIIQQVQETIWDLELSLFAQTEQTQEVKKEIDELRKGLADGTFANDPKKAKIDLENKYAQLERLTNENGEIATTEKHLINQHEKIEFLKRYKAGLKD